MMGHVLFGLLQPRAVNVDLQTDATLQVDISDALSERDKVKFTVHTKVSLSVCLSVSVLLTSCSDSVLCHVLQSTLPNFKQNEFSVVRQHEEFIWLHDSFVENEDYAGYIVRLTLVCFLLHCDCFLMLSLMMFLFIGVFLLSLMLLLFMTILSVDHAPKSVASLPHSAPFPLPVSASSPLQQSFLLLLSSLFFSLFLTPHLQLGLVFPFHDLRLSQSLLLFCLFLPLPF